VGAVRLEVGRVAKAHGLRGEVVVVPVSNQPARFAPGSRLWAGDDPVTIVASRAHRGGWIVRFDGVADRDAADRLRGRRLTAEPAGEPPPGEVWVHEVVGAEVRDPTGTVLGHVAAVEANPAHDLLVLDGGALVPVVFVVSYEGGIVVVDPPEGLLDL
jgi:16S rRNA processing protein RimM